MNASSDQRLRIFSPLSKPDEGYEAINTRQKLADAAAIHGYRLIEFTAVNDSLLRTLETFTAPDPDPPEAARPEQPSAAPAATVPTAPDDAS